MLSGALGEKIPEHSGLSLMDEKRASHEGTSYLCQEIKAPVTKPFCSPWAEVTPGSSGCIQQVSPLTWHLSPRDCGREESSWWRVDRATMLDKYGTYVSVDKYMTSCVRVCVCACVCLRRGVCVGGVGA